MRKYFINENEFPLVISPLSDDTDLLSWAQNSTTDIRELLNKYGVILFRGFKIFSVNEFETFSFVASGGDWVEYREEKLRLLIAEKFITIYRKILS